jgi:hypothetical protein
MDLTTTESIKAIVDALPLANRPAVEQMLRQLQQKSEGDAIQEKRIYAVWTNTDLTEGRGREYVQYHCENESTARRLAKKNYVMGTDGRVTVEKMFYLNGRWYAPAPNIVQPSREDEIENRRIEAERKAAEAKAAALAKAKELGMTEADLAALGA